MKAKAVVAALFVTVVGCHYRAWPVRLEGSPGDVASLAGEWVGEYSSAQSGRSGSIIFRLAAGRDTAFGDVLMIDSRSAGAASVRTTDQAFREHSSQLLRIAFVRIAGQRMAGALDPYTEPECHCTARTIFTGTVSKDVVEGTFVTRDESGREQRGRWRASRQSP
jgi:hypothetical protein